MENSDNSSISKEEVAEILKFKQRDIIHVLLIIVFIYPIYFLFRNILYSHEWPKWLMIVLSIGVANFIGTKIWLYIYKNKMTTKENKILRNHYKLEFIITGIIIGILFIITLSMMIYSKLTH